jgi:hypothetical protein
MIQVMLRSKVADYAKWRPYFDADLPNRRAGGATGVEHVFRDLDDPNTVTILLEMDSAEKANQFMHNPALAETMKASGVIGMPEVHFLSRA